MVPRGEFEKLPTVFTTLVLLNRLKHERPINAQIASDMLVGPHLPSCPPRWKAFRLGFAATDL